MRSEFDAQRDAAPPPENTYLVRQMREADNWRLVERDLQEHEDLWPLQAWEAQ